MQALSIRGLTKTYANGVQALQGHRPRRRGGRFLRAARPQRRRQVHPDRHRHLAGQQDRAATVAVFGHDIDRELDRGASACIGLVPQEINFNQFEKPFDIIVNQAGFYGMPRAAGASSARRST